MCSKSDFTEHLLRAGTVLSPGVLHKISSPNPCLVFTVGDSIDQMGSAVEKSEEEGEKWCVCVCVCDVALRGSGKASLREGNVETKT